MTGSKSQSLRPTVMLIAFAITALSAAAQQRTLLALSKADHMLAIVDPATLKVIKVSGTCA